MKLTEAEMRMVFQIESTNQNAALNEIYMTWRYAPNPATKETAEGLLDKLRPLSDQECMDLIRKVQAEYRLPEKPAPSGKCWQRPDRNPGRRSYPAMTYGFGAFRPGNQTHDRL